MSTLVSSRILLAAPSVFQEVEPSEDGLACRQLQMAEVEKLVASKSPGLRTLQRLGVKYIDLKTQENRVSIDHDHEVTIGFSITRQWLTVYSGFSQEDGFCGVVSARSIRTTLLSDNSDIENLEDVRPKAAGKK